MDEIERLATAYACRRDALRETVEEAQAALDRVKHDHHAALRRRIGATANPRAELLTAVESSPALFRQPRTRVLSGIRVDWRKRTGRIEIDDEPIAIPTDGEIDKLVAALLDRGEPAEQEAA